MPSIKNVLVITDHFMHYTMVSVMKDQTARTMAKVLYKWFIAVFGTPAKHLSDSGTNFTLTLVEELCALFGIQKCQTTTYHAQCNGKVERFCQTLFRMIGKLVADKKAQWEQHLPELLQVYNSMWSLVTGYSLHWLMFGKHPHLPLDFYFPTMGAHVHPCQVPTCGEKVRKHFKETYTEVQHQSNCEVNW